MDVLPFPSPLLPFNLSLISPGCLSLSCLNFTFPQPTHPHSHVSAFISFHHTQSFPFSLVPFFINYKVCTSFPLSLPSHHKQGLECLSKLILSDGMLLSFKKPHFILIPFFTLIFTCFLSVLSLCSSFLCQYTPLSIPPTECCVFIKHLHPPEQHTSFNPATLLCLL